MPSRRDLLATLGTAGLGSLTGCGGFGGEPDLTGTWHRPSYDRTNTAFAPDVVGPNAPLTKRWEVTIPDGNVSASPVVAGDRVYLGYAPQWSDVGHVGVRVLALEDGSEVRDIEVATFERGLNFVWYWDSLVVNDEAFYVLAHDGFHSFTLDGDRRWHVEAGTAPTNTTMDVGHPVIADGTAFFPTAGATTSQVPDATGEEALYAIDDESGEVLWRHVTGSDDRERQVWALPPAYADGTVYCSEWRSRLTALDADSGAVKWEQPILAGDTPTVAAGQVYTHFTGESTDEQYLVGAFSAETGERQWQAPGGKFGFQPRHGVAADNKRVYDSDGRGQLVAYDAATGEERWRNSQATATVNSWGSSPVVTSDALYVAANDEGPNNGSLAVLDPKTGQQRGLCSSGIEASGEVSVALADGVAVANFNGRVVAFESCGFELAGHCLL